MRNQNKPINLFEIIAETNRRNIIDLLRTRPRSVGELVESSQLSQPGVSKHLRILREAGLVMISKDSQKHIYHLRAEPLVEIDNWLEPYRQVWSNRLDALEQFLDEEE
ncbi:ArsR/SmtB family transcription factor [Paenibacillus alginolyticus]|uniref:Metalloregulator ArsR/SmtB family transcription factor n=1 Tax=Paenibacillus alginolyticus TaxID=59839 RepID=A0ABT4GG54_9BACL|nr:metalloregulator ArsR/SmtB family transcription factor [Paenibacillus alginolyticus]MCY9695162.1 metalloregulator ArsR/SmtB family transcription factor [Paenibacillus alginolyticus]MEC0148270.1 metalloregulator ArsR/SmtB family transcription factor [Paenibacillus alginolyticus]